MMMGQERAWLLEQERRLNEEDAEEGEIDLLEAIHHLRPRCAQ